MTKQQAVDKFGKNTVELARDLYETDFGKVLFEEDCEYPEDCALNDIVAVMGYLMRADKMNKDATEYNSMGQRGRGKSRRL